MSESKSDWPQPRPVTEDDLRQVVASTARFGDWVHWTKDAVGGYNSLTVTARSMLAHLHGRHDDTVEPYEHCVLCELFRAQSSLRATEPEPEPEPEPEWRESADPDELAAAVAAVVEVQTRGTFGPWWPTALRAADGFSSWIARGWRFRVPASWVYELAAAEAAGVPLEMCAPPPRVPADWTWQREPSVDRVESSRADAVQLLRDLQDAACSVMARPDVLGMLHGQTRHALSDLIVDLALALDSLVVMS